MENKVSLDALFEYATEGILIADSKGCIVRINPSAERMFGYNKGELLEKKIEILIPDKLTSKHEFHRDKYNERPHPRSMGGGVELFGKRKNGSELPVEISLSPYNNGTEKFVIAFIVDITERKKVEERIKNYSIDLEQQVKDRTLILQDAVNQLEQTKEELKVALEKEKELNDMKWRFVSMASHEFRTPLATILSSLSLVNKYTEQENEEKRSKHILRIKSSVNNMTDILNDFLSLSKLEEGKIAYDPEQFDLKKLVEDIVQDMQGIAKSAQYIKYIHNGDDSMVNQDKKLVKHIFFNLISNAIKFSNENGIIEVVTDTTSNPITITVKDHGIGISEEDKKHLFERFFRGKNATNIQGTGLGLNIVLKYIELMKGEINLESNLDTGTTFYITLPKSIK